MAIRAEILKLPAKWCACIVRDMQLTSNGTEHDADFGEVEFRHRQPKICHEKEVIQEK
jgi:hypothetical protein